MAEMYSTRGATLTLKGRPSAAPATERLRTVVPPPKPKPPKVEAKSPKPAAKQAPPATPAAVDPEAAAAKAARNAEREAALRRVEALLRERWPAVFCVPRPPLALGIHRQILEGAGADIDEAELGRFLRWWTLRWDYLDAVAHGEPRRNLDGSPAEVPTPDQQCSAAIAVYGQARGAVRLAKIRAAKETQ
jgi:hypothetical protein